MTRWLNEWRGRGLLAVALGFFATGCATKGADGSTHFIRCRSNSECPSARVCSDERCVPAAVGASADSGSPCVPLNELTNVWPTPLPSSESISELVSDGRYLYVGGTSLWRVPASGGPREPLYASPVFDLAAAGGTVAWIPSVPGTNDVAGLTIRNADGQQNVALPSGVLPLNLGNRLLADEEGRVFFLSGLSSGPSLYAWTSSATTGAAEEIRIVDISNGIAPYTLNFVDRGQIVWTARNDIPERGVYITDISTGATRRLLDGDSAGYVVGIDVANVYYWVGGPLPFPAPITIGGVPREGGAPFVAYESVSSYQAPVLRVDDSGLYWIDLVTGGIYHASWGTRGPGELVVAANIGVMDFVMDECNLYLVDGRGIAK